MRILALALICMLVAASAWAEPYFSPERVPGVQVKKTTLLSGLGRPWSMVWLPDGGLLITERPGRVRLFKDGKTTEIPGAPKVLAMGQGGLLDISLHPRFKENRLVYFTMATGDDRANHTALVRAEFDGSRLTGVQEIFKTNQAKTGGQHFGSRMVWLPDGTLILSVGDGGNPPLRVNGVLSRELAQDLTVHLGKLVRLKDDGTLVESPAFTGADIAPGLYTAGHRNIQGMAWDPVRKAVWASEHGARAGDEINLIKAGGNYGWPIVSYSKEYTLPMNVADHFSLPGMIDPVVVWKWRFAPSGLLVYTGEAFPQWKGDLLAGGLRSRTIRLIELDKAGNVTGERDIPMDGRVRDIRQGPDGLVYVLTDANNGKLIRIEPK